jgi:hypothetical protein
VHLERFYIVNRVTKHAGLFVGSEIFERDGAYIIYGTLGPQPLWLPRTRGRWVEAERPSCPVIIPGAPPEAIERFLAAVRGLPLYAVEREGQVIAWHNGGTIKGEPIVNMPRVPGIGKMGKDQDAMLSRAVEMVALYRYFQAHGGELPSQARAWIALQRVGPQEAPERPAFGGAEHFDGLGGAVKPDGE